MNIRTPACTDFRSVTFMPGIINLQRFTAYFPVVNPIKNGIVKINHWTPWLPEAKLNILPQPLNHFESFRTFRVELNYILAGFLAD